MSGSDRRADIIRQVQNSSVPLSGSRLAEIYHVSRQVIVQDIALLRAEGYDIISTNRGYILRAEVQSGTVYSGCDAGGFDGILPVSEGGGPFCIPSGGRDVQSAACG